MSKFAKLSSLEVDKDHTVPFTLYAIEGEPALIVRPALESNKGYFNASLRGARKNMRAVKGGNITAGLLDETRDADRALYAEHVVVGWNGITDDSGKAVPFSGDDCRDFLNQLPNWLFDELREFCGSPTNFLKTDQVDADATGKN